METTCRIKPYIQPFERRLAIMELEAVTGCTPHLANTGEGLDYTIPSGTPWDTLVDSLAYWERLGDARPTRQVLREATANVVRNGVPLADIRAQVPFPEPGNAPLPNRRVLRYGPHGLHEYRGKFFPQLVRSLINVAGVPQGGTILDPMCGSGTTAVEAILSGRGALALDMNPLSVLMTQSKCAILREDPATLETAYESVRHRLLQGETDDGLEHFRSLPTADQAYLKRWFAADVLQALDSIVRTIGSVEPPAIRDIMLMALSNILRSVSWQKVEDLRVRKEVRLDVDIDPVREFLEELGRSVRMLLAFLYQEGGREPGPFEVREGDARHCAAEWPERWGTVDAVITSPPYATALPYLDTDRLSLAYLGLLQRKAQRTRDTEMIGNREVTKSYREHSWRRFREEGHLLPNAASDLITRIKDLNDGTDAGFRRQNLPGLLGQYFFDMRDVFIQMQRLLKPGAPAYVVVGDNHTVAGGQRVDIETSSLLGDLAASVGFEQAAHIPMEMLTSRDIFKKNAIASEVILVLVNKRA